MKKNINYLNLVVLLLVSACSSEENSQAFKYTELEVWFHSGSVNERKTIQQQVARYNHSQHQYRVNAVILPGESYSVHIDNAALNGELPDIVEFDGPFIYQYINQGHLIPLDKLLSETSRTDLLPAIIKQSMYQSRMYSVSVSAETLALYAHRSSLEKINARIPKNISDAWTIKEFGQILGDLSKNDHDGAVLDLQMNRQGEWLTFAFSPILQSAGGDLINRSDYRSANGVLNSKESVYAMGVLQSWFKNGLIDLNTDNNAFTEKRVALSWGSQREFYRYHEILGDDLIILPLPNFRNGSKTGQSTWNLGITTNCDNTRAAIHFLEFLLDEEEVIVMAKASGTIPATYSAIEHSPEYKPGSKLEFFVEQLESAAVSRPQTPAYPVISSSFQNAFSTIIQGADVSVSLTKAANNIDLNIIP